jgi:hypothetical protein
MRFVRYLLCFLALCAVAGSIAGWKVLSMLGRWRGTRTPEFTEVADFTDDKFKILLFPVIEDSKRENPTNIHRAVLATLEENKAESMEVLVDNAPVVFDRDLLTAVPPKKSLGTYVDGLNAEIVAWGEDTDWRRVRFDVVEDNDSSVAELTVVENRGYVFKYRYRIHDSHLVTPISMSYANTRTQPWVRVQATIPDS